MGVPKVSDHIQIKIKMATPSQEPPESPKAPNLDFKHMGVLCTFKIKIDKPKFGLWYYQRPMAISKSRSRCQPQSGTSSILQMPKWRLKGHGCSLHLQNQDRELKFRTWVYQRPSTIFKLRWRSQTQIRNLQHPPKSQFRTLRTWMFFAPSKSK